MSGACCPSLRNTVLLATRNPHKLIELRRYLRGIPARLVTLDAYPQVPPVREDGATFEQNAVKKAVLPSRRVPVLVVAEDSGLVVPALGGAPGVTSARFAAPVRRRGVAEARRGLSRDAANTAKLLRRLQDAPPARRRAAFVCVVAVARAGHLLGVVRGECRGTIADRPRGTTGFGYDPVFVPAGERRTFAELGPRVKDAISHRARALRRARPLIARSLARARGGARTPAL